MASPAVTVSNWTCRQCRLQPPWCCAAATVVPLLLLLFITWTSRNHHFLPQHFFYPSHSSIPNHQVWGHCSRKEKVASQLSNVFDLGIRLLINLLHPYGLSQSMGRRSGLRMQHPAALPCAFCEKIGGGGGFLFTTVMDSFHIFHHIHFFPPSDLNSG